MDRAARLDPLRESELSHIDHRAGFALKRSATGGLQVPDLPGDGRALRATRQDMPHDEASLVSRRLSAHKALELLRLWMRHVAMSIAGSRPAGWTAVSSLGAKAYPRAETAGEVP